MRNHNEKLKDMAESVLPSTHRRSARIDAEFIRRRNRRAVRVRLGALRYDDYDDSGVVVDEYPYIELNQIRQYRREGDKLSIVHWAEQVRAKKLNELPDAEAYEYFRRVLPDNLIGRHALGHIRSRIDPHGYYQGIFYPPLVIEVKPGFWRFETFAERQVSYRAKVSNEVDMIATQLRRIIESGNHKRLNHALRHEHDPILRDGCKICGNRPRLLLGLSDVADFAKFVQRSTNSMHYYYKRIVEEFADADRPR